MTSANSCKNAILPLGNLRSNSVPQAFESHRGCSRIDLSVRNIAVSQIILNKSSIATFIGQCESATVSEHVRMNFNTKTGALADFCADVVESLPCHWATLRKEDQRRIAARRVDPLP